MILGDDVFGPTESLDLATYKRLKSKLKAANLPLLMYFTKMVLEDKTKDEYEKRRSLWLGHIALEIMGAGTPSDEDYVEVDWASIKLAEHSQKPLDLTVVEQVKPSFCVAVTEAKEYVKLINDDLNNCENTEINSDRMWEEIFRTLVRAYGFAVTKNIVKRYPGSGKAYI